MRSRLGEKKRQPSAIALKLEDGSYIAGQTAIIKYLNTNASEYHKVSVKRGLQIIKLVDIPDDEDFVRLGGRLYVNGRDLCSYRTIAEASEEYGITKQAVWLALYKNKKHLWYTVETVDEYQAYCKEIEKANEKLVKSKR